MCKASRIDVDYAHRTNIYGSLKRACMASPEDIKVRVNNIIVNGSCQTKEFGKYLLELLK